MKRIIGTAPNQIPTNGDLGSSAYINHEDLPVSSAQTTALAGKANVNHTHTVGQVTGLGTAALANEQQLATEFWSTTEPDVTWPGMVWADTLARVLKRRNDDDTTWVIESRLLTAHMPVLPDTDIPTTDIGPIYVVGQGDMEWNGTAGTYVAMGGGAQGGGANKVFWVNDAVITEDFTVKGGTRAGSFGPLELADGVVVEVEPGAVWTIV